MATNRSPRSVVQSAKELGVERMRRAIFPLTLVALALVSPKSWALGPDDPLGSNYIADVAERVTPAVVNITTARTRRLARMPLEEHPFFRDLFPPGGQHPRGGPREK